MKAANHTDIRAKRKGIVCRLATINLKTAGKPGALHDLGSYLTSNEADIAALQEPYLRHGTPHELQQKDIVIIAAQKKTAWAVARKFLEGKTWAAVNISDRVSALKIHDIKMLMVNVYAPAATKFNTKEERIRFWETLPGLIKGVKEEGDHVCLMGDFNIAFPPWLVGLWGHTVASENEKRDQQLTKEQEDVATAALTAMAKMDIEITTWHHPLPSEYHTYENDNFGTGGVRTIIDHMAMSGGLLTHVEKMEAIWPKQGQLRVLKPDHALVMTQVAVHGSARKSRKHNPEPPPFELPPDTEINRLADELRINMATRMFTSQERGTSKIRGVTEHGAVNATMRTPFPVRKTTNEDAEAGVQSQLDTEMQDEERLKEARKQDDAALHLEMAEKMMECLKNGDAAGIFKVARGRGLARPSALVSSAGKKEMTATFRSLVGEKHAPRDAIAWDFPELYRERPAEVKPEEWELSTLTDLTRGRRGSR